MVVRGRVLRTIGIAAAALVILVLAALPPAARPTPHDSAITTLTARGAYHVHSVRSDGSGTPDDIATAAANAGLKFVILTDHGDGTRAPDPPHYRNGVLMIDAVEISSGGGHYVALGMGASPYPIAGTAADVVEDVGRLGGFGIAAHPGSARAPLRWSGWTLKFDGVEWLNADSEWRDESWDALARSFLTYAFRSPETLASLLDRSSTVLARWDTVTGQRRVVALAGADAHARLGFQQADPDVSAVHVPLPRYAALFRTFSNHVELDRPLSGDAAADSKALLAAIREGRVFSVIDGLATPGAFEFHGTSGTETVSMGADLALNGQATLHAHIAAPAGTTMTLLRDGVAVGSSTTAVLDADVTGKQGAYRVEAKLDSGAGVPWLVSNPIYVGFTRVEAPTETSPPPTRRVPAAIGRAQTEAGPTDSSTIGPPDADDRPGFLGEQTISWRFALGAGVPSGQFAAISVPVQGGLAGFNRVQFAVKAERPMRVWVQMRAPVGNTERWGATFHAGTEWAPVSLRFEDFRPIGVTSFERPPLDTVDALLIVADTMNALPGTKGALSIRDVAFVRQ